MSLNKKKVVYIVYYSMYGHVLTMAKQIAKGLESAGGIYYNDYCYSFDILKKYFLKLKLNYGKLERLYQF